MKKLSRCLWMGLAVVSMLGLAGCNRWQNQLVGSWKEEPGGGMEDTTLETVMSYRKDGTGTIQTSLGEREFGWKVTGSHKIQRKVKGFGWTDDFDLAFDGDRMVERNADNVVIKYVRVPDGTQVEKRDPAGEFAKSMEESQKEKEKSDAAKGIVTAQALRNAGEDDKKFIEMFMEVEKHLAKVSEIVSSSSSSTEQSMVKDVKAEFDAAWNLQVNHFGTPARFNETNAKLRAALLKYQRGIQTFAQNGDLQDISEGDKLMKEAKTSYAAQILALHRGSA